MSLIPNLPSSPSLEQVIQSTPDTVDFTNILLAASGVGVVSGGAVTQHSTGTTLQVDVSAVVANGGASAAATSVTAGTADATNPRLDLVVFDTSNSTVSLLAGTAAANPVMPAPSATQIQLGLLYVGPGVTGLVTADIVDKRILIPALPYGVKKSADTGRTNNTLTDDPHLVIPVAPSTTYKVEATLIVDGSASGDFKWNFNGPSGATAQIAPFGQFGTTITTSPNTGSTFIAQGLANAGVASGMIGVGSKMIILLQGILVTSSTAGNLTLQWAQGTTNATATTVYTGSSLRLTPI